MSSAIHLSPLKKTPIYNKHIALNAKMVPFAGFEMPVSYSGVNDEHLTVRNAVGIFDVSHMGEFVIKGKEATQLIQFLTTNDVSVLKDKQAQYSCMTNTNGGIIDDLIVYRWNENEYYLVVNASNIDKDFNWIKQHNQFDADVQNISNNLSLLAVQGPNAIHTLQKLTSIDLSKIPYYHFEAGEIAGIKDVIISNTGYTGAGGFEIYVWNADAEKIWDAVLEAGKEFGIKPCGLGARDTLRLEMGFCLYGNDINDHTTPLEAGLGWITKFNKNFIGKDILLKQKETGIEKKLVGFEMIERGIPRQHYLIANSDGKTIGEVTSGTQSPSLNKGIGLGYVKTEFSKPDTEIFIIVRDKPVKAKIVKTPFIKK
ncbi:MAG: glycine cleavage system aminomethyltransferase GcvT [Bacteroidia bacterium]|nr:glycine cleavage system aminomethyltransferase GcvT [Bacteroidia bacterium]